MFNIIEKKMSFEFRNVLLLWIMQSINKCRNSICLSHFVIIVFLEIYTLKILQKYTFLMAYIRHMTKLCWFWTSVWGYPTSSLVGLAIFSQRLIKWGVNAFLLGGGVGECVWLNYLRVISSPWSIFTVNFSFCCSLRYIHLVTVICFVTTTTP